MLELIHVTENYTKQTIETKINCHDTMNYNVKSLAINLINKLADNIKFITIDSDYNKIKIDINNGSYYINTELGEYIEYESNNKTFIKKFKLV